MVSSVAIIPKALWSEGFNLTPILFSSQTSEIASIISKKKRVLLGMLPPYSSVRVFELLLKNWWIK